MIGELMHLSSQDLMPKMPCGDNIQCSKSKVQMKNILKQEHSKHGPLNKLQVGAM